MATGFPKFLLNLSVLQVRASMDHLSSGCVKLFSGSWLLLALTQPALIRRVRPRATHAGVYS